MWLSHPKMGEIEPPPRVNQGQGPCAEEGLAGVPPCYRPYLCWRTQGLGLRPSEFPSASSLGAGSPSGAQAELAMTTGPWWQAGAGGSPRWRLQEIKASVHVSGEGQKCRDLQGQPETPTPSPTHGGLGSPRRKWLGLKSLVGQGGSAVCAGPRSSGAAPCGVLDPLQQVGDSLRSRGHRVLGPGRLGVCQAVAGGEESPAHIQPCPRIHGSLTSCVPSWAVPGPRAAYLSSC